MPKVLVARPPLDAVEERTILKLARAAHLDQGPRHRHRQGHRSSTP
jgi:hypothetical protein